MTADFGHARRVYAESFGQPGQRTFRIRLEGSAGETAALWLEKQQVQALEMALGQMLAQLEYEPAAPPGMEGFPQDPEHEFKVGRMSMGYDHSDGRVLLHAYDLTDDENAPPEVTTKLSPDQCGVLRSQLTDIIAGGRPVCPLCDSPIDASGHACIRSNGHRDEPVPRLDDEEDYEA